VFKEGGKWERGFTALETDSVVDGCQRKAHEVEGSPIQRAVLSCLMRLMRLMRQHRQGQEPTFVC
jgi:hypothetical protein